MFVCVCVCMCVWGGVVICHRLALAREARMDIYKVRIKRIFLYGFSGNTVWTLAMLIAKCFLRAAAFGYLAESLDERVIKMATNDVNPRLT